MPMEVLSAASDLGDYPDILTLCLLQWIRLTFLQPSREEKPLSLHPTKSYYNADLSHPREMPV